jgi:hypothetical protein
MLKRNKRQDMSFLFGARRQREREKAERLQVEKKQPLQNLWSTS